MDIIAESHHWHFHFHIKWSMLRFPCGGCLPCVLISAESSWRRRVRKPQGRFLVSSCHVVGIRTSLSTWAYSYYSYSIHTGGVSVDLVYSRKRTSRTPFHFDGPSGSQSSLSALRHCGSGAVLGLPLRIQTQRRFGRRGPTTLGALRHYCHWAVRNDCASAKPTGRALPSRSSHSCRRATLILPLF